MQKNQYQKCSRLYHETTYFDLKGPISLKQVTINIKHVKLNIKQAIITKTTITQCYSINETLSQSYQTNQKTYFACQAQYF